MCLAPAGYEVESIHEASDPVDAVRKAEGIFIGEEQLRGLMVQIPTCTAQNIHCKYKI